MRRPARARAGNLAGRRIKRWMLAALAALSPAAQAELTQSGPGGFTVSHRLETPADPATVYAQMQRIGEWWNPDHSWSGRAENLYLDADAGCFCEKLPEGGSVEHLRIIYRAPGSEIRFDGVIGEQLGRLGLALAR